MLAVEPMRFIYRGRIAVFSIKVLRDERICVVAEQRPDCSEEESFQVRTEPSHWSSSEGEIRVLPETLPETVVWTNEERAVTRAGLGRGPA